MDINVGSCLGTLLLILALSADLLTASMVYGAGHIGISLGLTILISGLGSAILGTALFIGQFLGDYFPGNLLAVGSGVILIALGTYKTVDFRIRRWRKEYVKPQKNLMLSLGGLRIILNIYGDPLSADEDDSRTLSVGEAILLTIAMSLDGFAAGVGYSMNDVSVGAVITAFFLASLISIRLGHFLGCRIVKEKDYSWIGGVLLIFLGFFGIFQATLMK